jgi:CRISPR/Cas system CMR subunit Cmr4 (Cas7 group RAMP superfamily)
MSDVLTFRVTFHTPFRVATGSASEGADAAIDRRVPVPGSSVKGVMRAAARDVLGGVGPGQSGGDHPLVTEVFGDAERLGGPAGADACPWHWEDVDFGPSIREPQLRNRIAVDRTKGTVVSGALLVAEELAPTSGTMQIWQSGRVAPNRVDLHRALLAVSAVLVDGVGADRRAGTGWVSLAPVDVTDPSTQHWPPSWERCIDLVLAEAGTA